MNIYRIFRSCRNKGTGSTEDIPVSGRMHMKDDQIHNAQLKQGYNIQIVVDSEYIVAADIFQDRNDV